MTRPPVSVITPSYNQAEFIGDTLESVANQTYPDVTHVVVDGGSDDGTLDLLRDYEEVDWISESDRGQSHAINKGLDRADGDVIGWINSDDPYLYTDTIETVVDAFRRTGADVLYGHAVTIGPQNWLLRVQYLPAFDPEKLRRLCYLVQPAVFFRDYVFDAVEINEQRDYSMDYELWLDLAGKFDIRRIEVPLAADRNHPDRKIIAETERSAADTAALREERSIDRDLQFKTRQLVDRAGIRGRRIRALPLLRTLLQDPADRFAFDIRRKSFWRTLPTQLFRQRRKL